MHSWRRKVRVLEIHVSLTGLVRLRTEANQSKMASLAIGSATMNVVRNGEGARAATCAASGGGHASSAARQSGVLGGLPRSGRSPSLTTEFAGTKLREAPRKTRSHCSHRLQVMTTARYVKSGFSTQDLQDNGGRLVANLDGKKILIQEFMGDVYAVSNKCPHLNLSMQGKTALLSAKLTDDGCIVCPAHGSQFKLDNGEQVGEWCPNLPDLPLVGKVGNGPAPLPVYQTRVTDSGDIEVDIDGSSDNPDSPSGSMSMDEEDVGVLRGAELQQLINMPLADSGKGENVVGAEGVPLAIIEAERKSKPLRRYRLGSYALASSVAAAQMVSVIQAGVEAWPTWNQQAVADIGMDILVIISGTLLWRTELQNRAESLKTIWAKAQSREESLKRAEAGLGDTLWTSRMRKKKSKD